MSTSSLEELYVGMSDDLALMPDAVSPEPGSGDARADASDTAKKRQILDGARRVFFEHGFEAASMNDITRAAGVSKGTIYAYFPSKEALFEALVNFEREEQVDRLVAFDVTRRDIDQVLHEFAVRLVSAMTDPRSVARLRMVVGVAPRFPEIGRKFFEAGAHISRRKLGDFLTIKAEEGLLVLDDPSVAARQFLDLTVADIVRRVIFGLDTDLGGEAIAQNATQATAMFLKAYGPAAT
ncbi:TetR/AcrR family transcriptional regulator [Phreatobacter aquaticus]|uniref:TetR/AcrR family transcriptional regulator n=1 Tax=Phreatobacter aquaticus TaxID=2570229 RepID=UPI001AEF6AC2|nr:TetR/AcrR family transcriptional regulator [Phreatobacter aquaticus]